jgi:ATP-dependent RNA helicase DeaD
MDSFEDLGLAPGLVEALAAEGAERPTPLQSIGIPIVRRGNNVVAHAGPGAGTLITYGAGLLDRLEPGAGRPRALVIAPTTLSARGLAEALARLAQGTGHAVSSLGAPWVLPERADVLFATASELLVAARATQVDLGDVQAVVLDGASVIQRLSGLEDVETLLEYLPREGQRIIVSLPVTAEVADFAERHAKRAVHVPPQAAVETSDDTPRRGSVRFRIVDEPKEEAALEVVAELLAEGELPAEEARHVVLFFRNEDEAADAGDFLTLHGYRAGAPGESDAAVWLAVDELQALRIVERMEGCAVVSFDVPNGPDSLDRRHGGGRGGTVLVLARELAHLRDVARRTGYRIAPAPPAPRPRLPGDLSETLDALAQAMEEEDLAPYLMVLESFFREHAPAEVAAAAMALLRKKKAPVARVVAGTGASRPGPAWVRLFISLGSRDQVGPGDLVGAITGEAGVEGSQVGKIEIKDTFSVVEVGDAVAEKVIRSLNGTTVRGRSVRVDFDRARRGQVARPKRRTGPRP